MPTFQQFEDRCSHFWEDQSFGRGIIQTWGSSAFSLSLKTNITGELWEVALPSLKVASTFRKHQPSASSELVDKHATLDYMNVKDQQQKNIVVQMDLECA